MGKIDTAIKLLKLNNKLGLLDAGDIASLAGTAYRVKHFDYHDHLPDWEIFEDEEYERAERRKTFLTAAAVAGGAYLLYKNRDAIANAFDKRKVIAPEISIDVKTKAKKLVDDSKDLGEEVLEDGKKAMNEAKKKGEDIKEDVKEKGEDIKDEAIDKASEKASEVSKKADKASKDIKDLK